LALKGFFTIAKRWQLTRPQAMNLLGLTATSTYANWKNCKTSTIPRDTIERISYLLKIDETLKLLHGSDIEILEWLQAPHKAFKDLAPMDKMLQGNVVDIYQVYDFMPTLLEKTHFGRNAEFSNFTQIHPV
ncbi:MAG: hypothetical protein MI867_15865, partial [Pseudomonadales bacterium]|nr:hypothetical protein [Pseudomonadales bacterium]